jgi:nucleotide-binding universal stress UspA family protein
MQNSSVSAQPDPGASPVNAPSVNRGVVACLDKSRQWHRVAQHALAIAKAMSIPVTLLQVLEAGPAGDSRADPLEWEIRRREASGFLEPLAAILCDGTCPVGSEIVEGHAADQICLWAADRSPELIVLGAHGKGWRKNEGLGNTARSVLSRSAGSVLLVPATDNSSADEGVVRYKRLLIPLDGSSRAESVLPFAIRLAEAVKADLLITYVIPVPELIESGPLEPDDIELRERVVRRNERVAKEYLARVCGYIALKGIQARTMVLRDGDVRSRLVRLVADENADLVILSAHGHSGRSDAPFGSVTAHLIAHSAVPVLIVRNPSGLAAGCGINANLADARIAGLCA